MTFRLFGLLCSVRRYTRLRREFRAEWYWPAMIRVWVGHTVVQVVRKGVGA